MISSISCYVALAVAAIPFIYYLIALFSSWQFFRSAQHRSAPDHNFAPPVSNLKPIRGLDPDAYDNFASFCRQDYPDYELLFCVGEEDDPVVPILKKLERDFPERRIRVLFGSGGRGSNDKVVKLARLVSEAQHEVVVISDSDVRARPDYLRTVVAPLVDPKVGAVTCFYVPIEEKTLTESLQTIGMFSDFYAGILVARQLDGVKFALGPTIATTRTRLAGFGGYGAIQDRPADDLLVGRLIAEQGYEVELLPYTISTVADYRLAARPSPQTPALDRGDAPYATLGAPRPGFHSGAALVDCGDCDPSLRGSCARLSWRVLCAPICHDLDGWRLGPEARFALEEVRPDPGLGCIGFLYLADQFCAQQYSLAGRPILYP